MGMHVLEMHTSRVHVGKGLATTHRKHAYMEMDVLEMHTSRVHVGRGLATTHRKHAYIGNARIVNAYIEGARWQGSSDHTSTACVHLDEGGANSATDGGP